MSLSVKTPKRKGSRLRQAVASALIAMGVLLLVVTFTPLVPWSARVLAGPWDDPTGETLIILGGSALEDGILGDNSYWRSVYAVRAYREHHFAQVVVSGGGAGHIAPAMRDFLVSGGVPANVILVEDRSTSTRENAVYVKQILADRPGVKVLLTSDYHMFRARRVFAKAGLEVQPRPVPDLIKRSGSLPWRWPLFFQLCAETGKIVYYRARGWI